ncbi:hypothetical protein [Nocardiopsis sp. ATB16-24]|uniref:hypothetical protein n=1 Tax=Nocardiopsis sp. ATB16-24 TaxID=3019555 RepID=UPI002552B999|nr:hypothetical protein [Nocardiopsis sp. ATB16-24]
MTIETPPAGSPSPRRNPARAETESRGESTGLVLRGLATELRARGWEVREDGARGAVDVGPRSHSQQVLLRPHRGDLWWWMRWPPKEGMPPALAGVPISPVTRTADAARRVVGALAMSVDRT